MSLRQCLRLRLVLSLLFRSVAARSGLFRRARVLVSLLLLQVLPLLLLVGAQLGLLALIHLLFFSRSATRCRLVSDHGWLFFMRRCACFCRRGRRLLLNALG